jgi:hypothetical protein
LFESPGKTSAAALDIFTAVYQSTHIPLISWVMTFSVGAAGAAFRFIREAFVHSRVFRG